MSDNDDWHYVSDIHGGAEEHHRHYDLERHLESAQREIRELRQDLREALERITTLERSTPEARQAQYEADIAAVNLAESSYGEPW